MSRTVLQTYLAERLQSAKGLGWPMPEAEIPWAKRNDPGKPGYPEKTGCGPDRPSPEPGVLTA
jgi:hypothetical protein